MRRGYLPLEPFEQKMPQGYYQQTPCRAHRSPQALHIERQPSGPLRIMGVFFALVPHLIHRSLTGTFFSSTSVAVVLAPDDLFRTLPSAKSPALPVERFRLPAPPPAPLSTFCTVGRFRLRGFGLFFDLPALCAPSVPAFDSVARAVILAAAAAAAAAAPCAGAAPLDEEGLDKRPFGKFALLALGRCFFPAGRERGARDASLRDDLGVEEAVDEGIVDGRRETFAGLVGVEATTLAAAVAAAAAAAMLVSESAPKRRFPW